MCAPGAGGGRFSRASSAAGGRCASSAETRRGLNRQDDGGVRGVHQGLAPVPVSRAAFRPTPDFTHTHHPPPPLDPPLPVAQPLATGHRGGVAGGGRDREGRVTDTGDETRAGPYRLARYREAGPGDPRGWGCRPRALRQLLGMPAACKALPPPSCPKPRGAAASCPPRLVAPLGSDALQMRNVLNRGIQQTEPDPGRDRGSWHHPTGIGWTVLFLNHPKSQCYEIQAFSMQSHSHLSEGGFF